MTFEKDFNELFNDILTDYKNQFPEADTSQGSLIYIKSACLASALWGLYKYQEWISAQIFPDTADTEALDHHAWIRGLTRKAGETDAAYLERLLDYIRRPPAGGNQSDYVKWSLEITNVAAAYCYPLAQGLGTVDVVILASEANTGSEIPSSHTNVSGTNDAVQANKLKHTAATFQTDGVKPGDIVKNTTLNTETTVVTIDGEGELTLAADIFTATPQDYEIVSLTEQVKEYIDTVRPVTASIVRVIAPTILSQDVTMSVTGSELNIAKIKADIEAYLNALEPDETLYVSQLISIAIQAGADDADVTTPAADVVPNTNEMIRPGTVNVT
jgi:uncharacterized phage protein gp47/JayE